MMTYLSALISLGNDGDEVVRLETVMALGVIPREGHHPRVLEKLAAQVDIMVDLHGSAALVRSLIRDVLTVGSLPLDRAFAAAVYGAFEDRGGHPVSPSFRDAFVVKRLRALAGSAARTASLLASAADNSSALHLGGLARAKEVTEQVSLLLDALQAMLPSLEAAVGGGLPTPTRGGSQGINLGLQSCVDEGAEALRELEQACKALSMPSALKHAVGAVASGWKILQARTAGAGRTVEAPRGGNGAPQGGGERHGGATGAGPTPSKKESSSYSSMMSMMSFSSGKTPTTQLRPAFTLEDAV